MPKQRDGRQQMFGRWVRRHPKQDKGQGSRFQGGGAEGVGAQREHISPSVLKIRQSRSSRRPRPSSSGSFSLDAPFRCGSSPSSSSWLLPSPSSAPSPWPAVAAEVTMEVMAVEASAEASEAVEDWEAEEALAEASEAETSEETVTRNT
nr:uncharacterized protein LOC113822821 [Penaeus vannamei]